MKNIVFCSVLAIATLLSGCGHKGPLTMPPEAPQPPVTQAAPAPDSSAK